ncbi:hypothetical protein D3C81_1915520 [compost metagenome]
MHHRPALHPVARRHRAAQGTRDIDHQEQTEAATGLALAALIRLAQVRQHRRLEAGARIGNDQVQGIRFARRFETQPLG